MREAQRPVLPAPERGLRAPGRGGRGAARGARGRPRSGGRRGAAPRSRTAARFPARGAFRASGRRSPRRSSCTGGSSTQSPAATARREVGWVQSCAMLVRREAADSVGYLDPDFFVYSEEVDFRKRLARRRLADPPRAARPRDPPRAARHRPLAGRPPPDRRVPPRPRPLHAQAPLEARGGAVAPAVGGVVRSAGARRALHAWPGPGHLLAPRPPGAATRQRRGHARGGRGLQRPPTRPGQLRQVPERSSSRAATS